VVSYLLRRHKPMKNLFWNSEEHRVRALWRLLAHGLLFFVMSAILGSLAMLVALLVAIATGSPFPSPSDPDFVQQFTDLTLRDPLAGVLLMLSTFLSVFLSVWLVGKWLDRRPLAGFGLHFNARWWADLGFGLALGILLMVGVFLVELAAGWVTVVGTFQSARWPFSLVILMQLVQFIGVGIEEEMLSRGYHLRNLAEGLNLPFVKPKAALVLGYVASSAVFGLLHAGNPNASVGSTINLVIAGLFLGLGYVLTGELAIPIGLHITWNFFQGNVFGFPVSGGASSTSFIAIQQGGPDLWTGGAFGPEAGLVGLLAIAVGCLLTVAWVHRQYGQVELKAGIAQYNPPRLQAQNMPVVEVSESDNPTK
jgi:membrane protease YdiL (CAAX protease family)